MIDILGDAKLLTLRKKCHKNVSEMVLIDRFSPQNCPVKRIDPKMVRVKKHYIFGHVWHTPVKQIKKGFNKVNNPSGHAFGYDPTGRCHKREFLLRFSKDRLRWLQWLNEAKKRYGSSVLNYTDREHCCLPGSILFSYLTGVGSEPFVHNVKVLMGGMALGRMVLEIGESFQLKEAQYPYIAHFGAKKSEIGAKNTYVWDHNLENATT
jgi:hypothetical protein